MAKTLKYLHYDIVLTDKAVVNAQQALYPGGIFMSPDLASTTYSAPIQKTTDPVTTPNIRSPWIIAIPDANYPTNVATIVRKSGGWFGIHLLFGNTYTYKWIGSFRYAASTTGEIGGTPVTPVAIAQRKWCIGFEAPVEGEILSMSVGTVSRDASRHVDGFGFAYRDNGDSCVVTPTNNGAAASPDTWERFYFRVRVAPTLGAARIWSVGGSVGITLKIDSTGRLSMWSVLLGVDTLQATSAQTIALNTWKRVDIILHSNAAAGGYVRVYVGREQVISVNFANGVGMSGHGANHSQSILGDQGGAALETFECDFDDWIGSAHPTELTPLVYTGLDWLNGSKVQFVNAESAGAGNAWTGDYRLINVRDALTSVAGGGVTTSVSAAALVMQANARQITTQLGSLGAVCFQAMWYQQQTASIAGSAATFGWRFDGLLDLVAIALVANTIGWVRRMYRPSGLMVPIANLTPLEIHYIKYGNVSPATCWLVGVSVELIGTFGAEDIPADEVVEPSTFPARLGNHCAPYPESPWARAAAPAVAPVIVHSGTYVGNGTVQELQFRAPVTWFLVMNVGASGVGAFWFSGANVSHPSAQRQGRNAISGLIDPSFVADGVEDNQQQRTLIRIIGNDSAYNVAATTYQYIAFEDPGGRFNLNGAFFHSINTPTFSNPLSNANFLANWFFAQLERMGSIDATFSLYLKGGGHTASNWSIASGAEVATGGGALTLGQLLSGVTLHADNDNTAFAGFRMDDGSTDPNKHKVLKIGSYVGDGSASRSIGFPGTPSGLRPLYAIVCPHNANAFHRCPLNTGTTSNQMGTGASIAATGIISGGIDSMVVGSLGNTNAVIYDWFVILGSATAGNNGWSIDGEFAYVEPDWNFDLPDPVGTDPIEDEEPPDEDPDPDPGPDDDDDCDAGEVCVSATTRIVNEALLEIGSTKILTNYCTQQTIEAQTARILYEPSVRAVLHAFPWPFATKYAALTLSAVQPSNRDWSRSYRQPVDCVFERRIAVDRGPGVDPKGPPFELSSDSSGGLIFTNESNPVLEYTMRPACVAFTGDALFREALKWHLAAAMAPPVTRMADKAKFCREQFEICIARANAIIRPDDPGLRITPDPDGVDFAEACQTANIQAVNLALLRIGCSTIANLTTDQSREAVSANLIFEHELRATLRDFPWKFAKRYNDALVLVGGTATVPVNVDWQYSYRLPSDHVMTRRLATTGTGRSFEREPITFEVGTDATGPLLFTGETDPNLEYTARIACAVARADDLFRDALAWRLACSLAPSLAQADPDQPEQRGRGPEYPPSPEQRISHKPNRAAMRERAARYAFAMYLRTLEKARVQDANEAEPEADGDAEWIEGRS